MVACAQPALSGRVCAPSATCSSASCLSAARSDRRRDPQPPPARAARPTSSGRRSAPERGDPLCERFASGASGASSARAREQRRPAARQERLAGHLVARARLRTLRAVEDEAQLAHRLAKAAGPRRPERHVQVRARSHVRGAHGLGQRDLRHLRPRRAHGDRQRQPGRRLRADRRGRRPGADRHRQPRLERAAASRESRAEKTERLPPRAQETSTII